MFHQNNLTTILKDRKKNTELYKFDLVNEFGEAKMENNTEGSVILNTFVLFANKETKLMPEIDISCLLKTWGPELKITKIYLDATCDIERNNIICKLDALDFLGRKHSNSNNKIRNAIKEFYNTGFIQTDHSAIAASVNAYTTFFLVKRDSKIALLRKSTATNNNKKLTNEIIGAITFQKDKMKKNVFILWLGISNNMPKKKVHLSHDPFYHGCRRLGLSTFLIMTVIKYCSVNNNNKNNLYLQASVNDNVAVSFYTTNGFLINQNKYDILPKSLQLIKSLFVKENHMMLMICSSGNFYNKPIKAKKDVVADIEHVLLPEKVKPEFIPNLPEKLLKNIKELDFCEKKRKDLNILIKNEEKTFDSEEFLPSLTNIPCMNFIPGKIKFCYYPLSKASAQDELFFANEEIYKLLYNLPRLKQFMKKNQSNRSTRRQELKYDYITSYLRLEMGKQVYFPFDILKLVLNIFMDGDETNNLVIISGYVVSLVREYREMLKMRQKLLRIQLNNKVDLSFLIKENDEKLSQRISQIQRVIGQSVWDSILDKRVIVYIYNDCNIHWNCTFIFNLKSYIIEYDNSINSNGNILQNEELSGFLAFDPLRSSTEYQDLSIDSGVIEFLNLIYIYNWKTNPNLDNYEVSEYPFNEETILNTKNGSFYQFKANSRFLLHQNDDYNCGLGLIFTIMRISRAFENNKVLKYWIDTSSAFPRAIIPSSVFYSIQYSTVDPMILQNLRYEIMDLLDNLSIALGQRFDKNSLQNILMTQYICPLYQKDCINDHCFGIDEYDYTKKERSENIDGMTENLHCKNAFELLDEHNHEFIDTISDNNTLFYQFGIFLHGEGHKEVPTKLITLVDRIREQFKTYWLREVKIGFKRKYYFSQSKGVLKKTLQEYCNHDKLTFDELRKYNIFLGSQDSVNNKAITLTQQTPEKKRKKKNTIFKVKNKS